MELVKKGKRVYGAFAEIGAGKVYVAFRRPKDFFLDAKKGEAPSISDAILSGKAAIAIDDNHLREARRRGCVYIAVHVRVLNWLFMTPIDSYFDPLLYYRRNYTARGGSDQRYLPCQHFVRKSCALKV